MKKEYKPLRGKILNSLEKLSTSILSEKPLKSNKIARKSSQELAVYNLLNKVNITNREQVLLNTSDVRGVIYKLRKYYKIKVKNRRVNTLYSHYDIYELDFSDKANIAKCKAFLKACEAKRAKKLLNN